MKQSEFITKSAKALLDYKPSQAMGRWTMIKEKFLPAVIEYVEATERFHADLEASGAVNIKLLDDDSGERVAEIAREVFEKKDESTDPETG